MSLLAELKRRNVFRAAAAYVAVAWLVMQVAEVTFPAFGLTERALRLLIITLAIGFVPATVLAWVFEFTPEGFKRERDLDRSGPLVARTNRLLDRTIVLLLALGLTYFAIDKFFLSPAREQARVQQALEQGRSEALERQLGDTSIVVLPFRNLSSDQEQAFFADGMTEELLNLLARVPELRVISRTSAFAFKDKDADIPEIAGKLKVSHVLEGSVRRSGDRLRIAAQLIEVQTDSPLWSETYDRTLDDVFEVQDEIAASVVDALKLQLLGEAPKSRRVNPQAYVLFMQARQMLDRFGDFSRTDDLLERALVLEPRYADAWTARSLLFYRCSDPRLRTTEPFCRTMTIEEAQGKGKEARETALRIDPDNATAIAYDAWTTAFEEERWAAAASGFRRAIELEPANSAVLRVSIMFARVIGHADVACRIGEYAAVRDPLCAHCAYELSGAYLADGRLDEADKAMTSYRSITGGQGGWHSLAMIRLLKGDLASALELVESSSDPEDPMYLHGRALVLHSLGRHRESAAALAQLESGWPREYPEQIAEVYAWYGDLEDAYAWGERAIESEENLRLPRLDRTNPFLQSVFRTPRGQALLGRIGLADEQVADISLDVRLPMDGSVRADGT